MVFRECDQMASLFAQQLSINNNENFTNRKKRQSCFKILPKCQINPTKTAQRVLKFWKSGDDLPNPVTLLQIILELKNGWRHSYWWHCVKCDQMLEWKAPKLFPKVAKASFYTKRYLFDSSTYIQKMFGLLLSHKFLPWIFKNCPIWSHWLRDTSKIKKRLVSQFKQEWIYRFDLILGD